MTLQRLASGLDDAFRLLTGGSRTALPRQQTLLASIAWSVDLLDDVDQAVLRRLAVFQGPFTLDRAEAVTTDDDLVAAVDVLDALARLVDKSLVEFDDTADRYRLLATVRQFGLDRLRDRGELAVTRTRHARWFAIRVRGHRPWSARPGHHDDGVGPARHPRRPGVGLRGRPPSAFRMIAGLGWVRTQFGHFDQLRRQAEWLLAQRPGRAPRAVGARGGRRSPWPPSGWLAFDLLDLLDDAVEALPEDAHRARRLAQYLGAWAAAVQRARRRRDVPARRRKPMPTVTTSPSRAASPVPRCRSSGPGSSHGPMTCSPSCDRALERHGQRLGAATGLLTYSIQIELAVWEGRFDHARALLASDVSLDVPELPTTAVAVALLGGVAGDRSLVELAESWVENREIHPIVAPAVLTLRHIRAVDGRPRSAMPRTSPTRPGSCSKRCAGSAAGV